MNLKEILKAGRIQTSGITALMPILGLWTVKTNFFKLEIFLLFIIGFLNHFFGFFYNEFCDRVIDRENPELKDKPFVKGSIDENLAVIIIFITISFSLFLSGMFNFKAFIINFLAIISIIIYDRFNNTFPFLDIFLGLSVFIGVIFGPIAFNLNPTKITYLLALWFSVEVILQNLLADLKDIPFEKSGCLSTTSFLGTKFINNKIYLSKKFLLIIFLLKLILLLIIFKLKKYDLKFLISLILFGLSIFFQLKIIKFKWKTRREFFKFLGFHEISLLFISLLIFYSYFTMKGIIVIVTVPTLIALFTIIFVHNKRFPTL